MNNEILIVFVIIAGAIFLFTRDKVPVDLTALLVVSALLLTGIITPEEGISGFSNSAVVTVGALFILSSALFKSGAINFIIYFLRSVMKKSYFTGLFSMMIISALISAFINNTAVVALFMPIVISVSMASQISSSKLLIPLSFSAIFGGVCTLIGTSTNILASEIANQYGEPTFGMFEMTPFGLILVGVGIVYLLFIGPKLLPDRKQPAQFADNYKMADYVTEIVLLPNAKSVDKEIKNSPLVKDLDLDILEIQKEDGSKFLPYPDTVLKAYDVLKVRCNIDKLKQLQQRVGIKLKSDKRIFGKEFDIKGAKLVEAVLTPNSHLIGKTLKGINFRNTFGATVLAIRHRGRIMREKLGKTILLPGDVLLIEVRKEWLNQLKDNPAFIIISELGLTKVERSKIIIAVSVIVFVVATAALNIIPIVAGAVIGSVVLILTGTLSLEEAYKSIDWKVIILLAGLVTLGIALEKTGGAGLLSDIVIKFSGEYSIHVLVSVFFFISMVLTAFMSNNASVAMLIPVAIAAADSLGIGARPLIMAVTFAASVDFMTPIGYQTNTMVYVPGNYRFSDYLKIGTPLNLLFWVLATLFIPVFFK